MNPRQLSADMGRAAAGSIPTYGAHGFLSPQAFCRPLKGPSVKWVWFGIRPANPQGIGANLRPSVRLAARARQAVALEENEQAIEREHVVNL